MCRIMYVNIKKGYRYYKDCSNEKEMVDILIKFNNIITHSPMSKITIIPIHCDYEDTYYQYQIDTLSNAILSHFSMIDIMLYMIYPLYVSKKKEE